MRALLDFFFARLIVMGSLRVQWPDGSTSTHEGASGPHAQVVFRTREAVRRMVRHPGLAFGECYMDGSLALGPGTTLFALMDLLLSNLAAGGQHPMEGVRLRLSHLAKRWSQFNPARRARRNAAHHYDLNGRLYELLLDPDLNYSCAYFATGQETLAEAQQAKKRHIARKLLLDRPGLDVLEIGSGWGGLALTLAREFGARVTGVTLSTEQLERSRARAAEAGLAELVRFELTDYRAVRGEFDRVVSVGMFEHVGAPQYRTFFRTVHDRLRPGGAALLHSIGRSHGPAVTNPWLAKYIFPGGYSPALSEALPAVERSGLVMTDLEILRLHYAETLRQWRCNLDGNRSAIQALYDPRFVRMFELYLIGAELAFRRQGHMVFQMQLARAPVTVPLARDYLYSTPAFHSDSQAGALTPAPADAYAHADHEHHHGPRFGASAGAVAAASSLEPAGGAGAAGRAARQQQGL